MNSGERRQQTGRNEPCPCGSGKKFKKCCIRKPRKAPGIPNETFVEGSSEREVEWNDEEDQHLTTSKHYTRYDCIFAVEGPYDPELLHRLLNGISPAGLGRSLRDESAAGLTCRPIGGPYRNIPPNQITGAIVLLTRQNMPVYVFNGDVQKTQRLLNVYRRNGTIEGAEIERGRERGDYIVDLLGSSEIRHDGQERKTEGTINPDIHGGEAIFVRDAWVGEEPEAAFVIHSFLSGAAPRILRVPLIARVDAKHFSTVAASCDPSTIGINPDGVRDKVSVALDPTTGELMDAIMPDGNVSFGIGSHDHVVLAIEPLKQVWKGTKAEMLDGESGKLAGLRQLMRDRGEIVDRIRTAVDAFDPSNGILFVVIPGDDRDLQVLTLPRPE